MSDNETTGETHNLFFRPAISSCRRPDDADKKKNGDFTTPYPTIHTPERPRMSRAGFLRACGTAFLAASMMPTLKSRAAGGKDMTGTYMTDTLTFEGTDFLFRWTNGGQREYTPAGQEDLLKWTEMISLVRYEDADTRDRMAQIANNVVDIYSKNGKILKVDAIQATPEKPAIYFIAAALGDPESLELALARLQLVENGGMAAVYSYRIFGTDPQRDHEASTWLDRNLVSKEQALMQWTLPHT